MNAQAESISIMREMVNTDYLQWDKFLSRMKELGKFSKSPNLMPWELICYKTEEWVRAERLRKEIEKILNSNKEIREKLTKWIADHNIAPIERSGPYFSYGQGPHYRVSNISDFLKSFFAFFF